MTHELNRPLLVRSIEQIDKYTLGIEWTDGHKSRWRLSHLRRHCPCAQCVDEWSGEALLSPEAVADNIQCSVVESVGRYAITIKFTDGHATGIYSFTTLRELCQCEECTAG
jgi:DUF971 family protein